MKKLKLNLDEIKVESFETNILESKKGTVNGHEWTIPYEVCADTVPRSICADISIHTYCPTSECLICGPETSVTCP